MLFPWKIALTVIKLQKIKSTQMAPDFAFVQGPTQKLYKSTWQCSPQNSILNTDVHCKKFNFPLFEGPYFLSPFQKFISIIPPFVVRRTKGPLGE